jgi:hypothetical protein
MSSDCADAPAMQAEHNVTTSQHRQMKENMEIAKDLRE